MTEQANVLHARALEVLQDPWLAWWFRRRYSDHGALVDTFRYWWWVEIVDQLEYKGALMKDQRLVIRRDVKRVNLVLAHELGHYVTWAAKRYLGHGPRFLEALFFTGLAMIRVLART